MKWDELLKVVSGEPLFNSSLLLAGDVSMGDLHRQLTRWVQAGRLVQIRRGWYTPANPYQKVTPHPFFIANQIKPASYVSLQSALSHYNMIPEYVPLVTSVTTGRPERLDTPLGSFLYRHIRKDWFFSCRSVELGKGQTALLATPEKALLDLIYLTPQAQTWNYLNELRLENMDRLNDELLKELAGRSGSKKLNHAVDNILKLKAGQESYQTI